MKKVVIVIVVIAVVVGIGYLVVSRLNPGSEAETATPEAAGQQLPPVLSLIHI